MPKLAQSAGRKRKNVKNESTRSRRSTKGGAQRKGSSAKRRRTEESPHVFPPVLDISKPNSNRLQGFFAGGNRPLTSTESSSWCHKTAARFASQHFAPGHVVRLLGVITRQLEEGLPEDLQIFNKVFKDTKQEPRQTRSLTLKQAIEQIRSENPDLKESELNMQGEQLRLQWKHALRKPFSVGWNSDGECSHKDGVSLVRILQVLEDLPEERQPTEIITLLQALLDLSCPDDSLYGIPLLNVHALWSSDTNTLRMGVYANRLLFEVMTQGLKVVLAALDEGSFKVKVMDDGEHLERLLGEAPPGMMEFC